MTDSQLTKPHRRARQEQQKQERRRAILDAAWAIFQQTAYDAVTMDLIAGAVGLAKGTLFLYFGTKEELFLAITRQQLGSWFEEADRRLAVYTAPIAAEAVVSVIAEALRSRPGLTRLLAILATVMEQNVGYAAILEFKQFLFSSMQRTGAELERVLALRTPGAGLHLLMQLQAIVIGLQHLADPAPIVRQVIAEAGMQPFDVDFDREFRVLALAVVLGKVQQ